MNLHRISVLICFAWFTIAATATEHHVFRRLETANDMSNNNVKAILKDKEGFLWVGTASGLNRYDGFKFKQYGQPELLNDIW